MNKSCNDDNLTMSKKTAQSLEKRGIAVDAKNNSNIQTNRTKRVVFSDLPPLLRTFDKIAPLVVPSGEEQQNHLWYSHENLQSIQRENKGILKEYCRNESQKSSSFCIRGLEAFFSKTRQHKRRLFRKGLLQMQNQLKGEKKQDRNVLVVAKELRLFTRKFTKYARERAQAMAICDATEAKKIYQENGI